MMGEWTPDLTLKHELLDSQHAAIFRCLAELAEALAGPADALGPAVAALADALVTHLANEEQLMDDALYPERTRHKSAHELFMADFLRMRRTLEEDGPTEAVADWVTHRIPDWLRFHIGVNDYPLAMFLARRRPQPSGHPARDGGRRPS
jgi:hemerythrin-like metal-binding protein